MVRVPLYWAAALLFLLVEQSWCESSTAAPVADTKEKDINASANPPVCEEDLSHSVINELIEWIKENEGVVDDRQAVKREDSKNLTSPQNVYATSFIPKGTVLLSVPWDLVVEPKDYHEDESDMCGMVELVHKELKANKNGTSHYGPYMKYLESLADPIMLPASWSQEGRKLLKQVIGNNLVLEMGEIDGHYRRWRKFCDATGSLRKDHTAAHLVIGYSSPNPSEREWYQMVPFYDLYSPREEFGEYNTELEQNEEEEEIVVYANRDIQAGEQIHTPMGFGETPGKEREFIHSGRIERRHSFKFTDPNAPFKNKDMFVEFDLDRVEVNGEIELNITWVKGVRPPSRVYNQIDMELERMKQISTILSLDALYFLHSAADHERKAIQQYASALIDALTAVAKSKHEARPVTPWTIHDYEVSGVNLGTYNLAGIEQVKEPKAGEKPYELFEDFDISDRIIGNENWKDMIEYRR